MDLVFNGFLIQALYFVGAVFLLGYAVSWLNRCFYRITGQRRAVVYATGVIGTPIHELSHAAMCLLFRHRIEEIRFFQISDENGVLGYVKHCRTKGSLYQRIGDYFIGVAPVMLGGGVVYLLMRLLIPDTAAEIGKLIGAFSARGGGASLSLLADAVVTGLSAALQLCLGITAGLSFFLFILLGMCIALHMNLSGADIKGALSGLPLLLAILFVINLAVRFLLPSSYGAFCAFLSSAGCYLLALMLLALSLSLLLLLLSLLVRAVARLIKRRRHK